MLAVLLGLAVLAAGAAARAGYRLSRRGSVVGRLPDREPASRPDQPAPERGRGRRWPEAPARVKHALADADLRYPQTRPGRDGWPPPAWLSWSPRWPAGPGWPA